MEAAGILIGILIGIATIVKTIYEFLRWYDKAIRKDPPPTKAADVRALGGVKYLKVSSDYQRWSRGILRWFRFLRWR